MNGLPVVDIIIILVYLSGVTLMGVLLGKRKRNSRGFMIAGGNLPGWVIGLSIFGTYLSSNTFLGIPGKAFSENWNSFVFSLSIPIAAWLAVKYFIPFYRKRKEISAYHQFEKRFGKWAKYYAVICFMLTQFSRMGSILFGTGLVLAALLHIQIWIVILMTGLVVLIYTITGGMEAVIWTDVIQSILLSLGAIAIVLLLVTKVPGGLETILITGYKSGKLSLGSLKLNFGEPTIWVVFLYGIFINLTNFGIDQNYVQRYHAAGSDKEAAGSVWLMARLYIPVSLLFFLIGTSLFVYTLHSPGFQEVIGQHVTGMPGDFSLLPESDKIKILNSSGSGDNILPLFIANGVPAGLSGLIIAALLAAAMSTLSSSLNSTATIYLEDIKERSGDNDADDAGKLKTLKMATFVSGFISIGIALAMIGVKSVLDAWWILSGIFSGGLLGLFILGWLTKVNNPQAMLAVAIGVLVILWMTLADYIPENLSWLKSPFHANMIIVIGTLSIFMAGLIIRRIYPFETKH